MFIQSYSKDRIDPVQIIIWKGYWTPQDCDKNKNYLFIFGDNLERKGSGGQAVIRGRTNAVGLATKHYPGVLPEDYFDDKDIVTNLEILKQEFLFINEFFQRNNNLDFVVLSENGYGHGLAQMGEKCPVTYKALNMLLKYYFGFDNLKAKELNNA